MFFIIFVPETTFFMINDYEEITDEDLGRQMPQRNERKMFKAPFSFKGRIRRTEYCLSILIYYGAAYIFMRMCENGYIGNTESDANMALLIYIVASYWFLLAQGTKRCHDRGNPWFFQIIPFYGLWMMFADGEPYDNRFGPDPKGRNYLHM